MKLLIGFLCSFLLCYITCHAFTQDSIFCATPFHQHILLAWHSLQILDLSNSEFQFVATRQFAELNENQTQERLWISHVKLVRHLNIHWVAFISEWNLELTDCRASLSLIQLLLPFVTVFWAELALKIIPRMAANPDILLQNVTAISGACACHKSKTAFPLGLLSGRGISSSATKHRWDKY